MAEAIILAGGKSSRMKSNKMLLPYQNQPIIFHTVSTVRPFVRKVIVVTGKYHKEIAALFKDDPDVVCIHNHDYELGMFSSVKTGVKQTNDDFLIIPGDTPLIKAKTYQKLIEAKGKIRVVAYQGKKGHPLFIHKSFKERLLKTPLPHLKAFRDHTAYTVVDVDDAGVLYDVDTEEDYHGLIKKG